LATLIFFRLAQSKIKAMTKPSTPNTIYSMFQF
jgi:hypothetical protein